MTKTSVISILTIALLGYVVRGDVLPPARTIGPQGEAPVIENDYFAEYHGDPCDFEKDDDFERIAGFGEGIMDRKVANGVLSFTTGEQDNNFYFGRWFYPKGNVDLADENIGADWPVYGQHVLRLRLRQSLPSSKWKIGYRIARGAEGNVPGRTRWLWKGKKIEGTDWQDLEVHFFAKGSGLLALFFDTQESGNRIEIDYVKAVNRRTPAYYRKTITLADKPVLAQVRLGFRLPCEQSMYVNGQLAYYNCGFGRIDPPPSVDISPYLRKGKNIIAVGSDNTWYLLSKGAREPGYELVCNGVILCEDGKYYSPRSSADWKGTFEYQDGWEKSDFNDTDWKPVEVKGGGSVVGGPSTYVGPLALEPDGDPVFRLSEGIDLSCATPHGYKVFYSLTNSFTREEYVSGVLAATPQGEALTAHTLKIMPDKPGVWVLSLEMRKKDAVATNKPVATRMLEVAVAGPIPQKKVAGTSATEGMSLREIVSIDCTDDSAHVRYRKGGKGGTRTAKGQKDGSEVIDVPFGSYRESGNVIWSGFGYMFTVSNLYKPHLIEVEYPDDEERLMMVKVFSGDKGALKNPARYKWDWARRQRWYSGVATGGEEFPASGEFKKLYLFYWPSGHKQANSIQIITERAGLRAAVRAIKVYEIDDIPALDIPPSPHRMYGQFVERERIVTRTFYSGYPFERFQWYGVCYEDRLGRVRDWYDTIRNLIKYMRYSGQNLYVPGYCMYSGIFFPETRGQSRGGGIMMPTDHFRLMSAMFEANDLNLIIGAQYMTSRPVLKKALPANSDILEEGRESSLGVCIDGRQSLKGGSAGSGVMDYQKKWADDDIRQMVRTFLKYGREFKSTRGILFYTAGMAFPSVPVICIGGASDSALAWGLDDQNVTLFKEETGVDLLVQEEGRDRMKKRHEYLIANPDVLEKWNEFRCNRVGAQLKGLLDVVREERPDWRLYVNPTGPAKVEREQARKGEITYREANRRRGFDPEMDMEGIVCNLGYEAAQLNQTGRVDDELTQKQDDSYFFIPRWPTPAHSHAVIPAEPYQARDMALALAQCTPAKMVFGKADVVNISGGEHRLREFVKAYRSIPSGEYHALHGNGLDCNNIVRAAEGNGRTDFYVVNRYRFPINTALSFAPDAVVTDLASGKKVDLKDNKAIMLMNPCSIRVFSGTTAPVSAETELTEEAQRLAGKRAELFAYVRSMPPEKIDLFCKEWMIGAERQDLLADLAKLESEYERGNVLRVLDLTGMEALARFLDCTDRYRHVKEPPQPRPLYRINCGADKPYKDSAGNDWLPDRPYLHDVDAYGYIGDGKQAIRGTIDIANTENMTIYRSELYNVAGYRILVPDGKYTVRLHFAETFKARKDMRVCDITIEGKLLVEKLDVFAEGGFRTAYVKELKGVEVKDGRLDIDFAWTTACPVEINGIEILPED